MLIYGLGNYFAVVFVHGNIRNGNSEISIPLKNFDAILTIDESFPFKGELNLRVGISADIAFEHDRALFGDNPIFEGSLELGCGGWNSNTEVGIAAAGPETILSLTGYCTIEMSRNVFDCDDTNSIFTNKFNFF